jgi:ribose 5-phosphate isomerase A
MLHSNRSLVLPILFVPNVRCRRRAAVGTANPRGGDFPYISEEGFNIVDIRFDGTFKLIGEEAPYEAIAKEISEIPGVVTHGLVLDGADFVVVADELPLATQLR